MSRLRLIPYAVLAAGLLASGGAFAQSMSTIDGRQEYQEQRIREGIRDGSITRSEANRLQQGEQRIDRAQQRARADGVVTPAERRRLDGMLDRESRAITHERNDGQRRDGWGGQHRDGQHSWNRDGHQGWSRDGHRGWQANRGFDHRGGNQQTHGGRDGTAHHYGQTAPATGTAPSHHGWTGTRGTSPGTPTRVATTPRTSTHVATTPRGGARTATTAGTGGRSFGGAGRHR